MEVFCSVYKSAEKLIRLLSFSCKHLKILLFCCLIEEKNSSLQLFDECFLSLFNDKINKVFMGKKGIDSFFVTFTSSALNNFERVVH